MSEWAPKASASRDLVTAKNRKERDEIDGLTISVVYLLNQLEINEMYVSQAPEAL